MDLGDVFESLDRPGAENERAHLYKHLSLFTYE